MSSAVRSVSRRVSRTASSVSRRVSSTASSVASNVGDFASDSSSAILGTIGGGLIGGPIGAIGGGLGGLTGGTQGALLGGLGGTALGGLGALGGGGGLFGSMGGFGGISNMMGGLGGMGQTGGGMLGGLQGFGSAANALMPGAGQPHAGLPGQLGGWGNILSSGLGMLGSMDQSRQLGRAMETAMGSADPFARYRGEFGGEMANLMRDPSSVQDLPGYQFELEQGIEAANRGLGASGQLRSGRRAAALEEVGRGTAGRYMQQHFDRLAMLSGAGQGAFGQASAVAAQLGAAQAQARGGIFDSAGYGLGSIFRA